MSMDGADFYPCGICGKPVEGATYHKGCVAADDAAALPKVPSDFKSKLVAFDVFARCSKCKVKKYINRESKLCFACHGGP